MLVSPGLRRRRKRKLRLYDFLAHQASVCGSPSIAWLLRDEFNDTRAAGAVHGTPATPGPGNRVATDTTNVLSITSGVAQFSGHNAAGDPRLHFTPAVVRAAGMALYMRSKDNTNRSYGFLGFDPDTSGLSGSSDSIGMYKHSGSGYRIYPGGAYTTKTTLDDFDDWWIVLRSTGAFYIRESPGIVPKLQWVNAQLNTTPLYVAVVTATAPNPTWHIDDVHVLQLGAPWTTAFGLATTQLAGDRSPGDTFTHEANVFLSCMVTMLPSAGQIELRFRVQDATNYWQVTVDSTGNVDLDEVVAGGVTQRGTSAAAIASAQRMVVVADGTTITVWAGAVMSMIKLFTYASATNFQTATSGELETEGTGGSVSDIIAWPRDMSGAALAELRSME